MAPNSEEERRRLPVPAQEYSWSHDDGNKEQRPPVYNPEDYAMSLRKWGKRPSPPPCQLTAAATPPLDDVGVKTLSRDYRNPNLTSTPEGGEMSLRQFSSVTELLGKLKTDLRLAFPSFVQEFIGDPVDGVTLLLELLRAVQLSQAAQQVRCPPPVLRRALLDEYSCLLCLKHCLRCADTARRLAATPHGLFTLAVCIMSNVAKSRIIALELLTCACAPPGNGHVTVSEALSTLRLRFGEPVRFRFLVGMLTSSTGGDLQAAGLRFINTFLETAGSAQTRLYIQAELEQAGFQAHALYKALPTEPAAAAQVTAELQRWERHYIDVATLQTLNSDVESKTYALQDQVDRLERRVKILQEEKGILLSLEQCLKERCSHLEREVHELRGEKRPSPATSPAEDEGISSSDQDDGDREYEDTILVPLERREKPGDWQRVADVETSVDHDDDDETTIDEVIEELRNIINDAESEELAKEEKERKLKEAEKRMIVVKKGNTEREYYERAGEEKRRVPVLKKEMNAPKITIQARNNDKYLNNETKSANNKVVNYFKNNGAINVKITSDENNRVGIKNNSYLVNDLGSRSLVEVVDAIETEVEIVPCKLLPQPPRKTRTVVQIVHMDRGDDSEDDSDSLLSAARDRRSTDSSAQQVYKYQVNAPICPEKQRRGSFDGLFFVTEDAAKMQTDIVIPAGDKSRFSSGRGSSEDWSLDGVNYCVMTPPKVIVTRSASIQQTTTTTTTTTRRRPPDGSSRPVPRSPGNMAFIKRGHANAGLYSDTWTRPALPVPDYGRNISPVVPKSKIVHRKVTDLPSGLY